MASPPPPPRYQGPPSPKATRFQHVVAGFQDDYQSKQGDWMCGYTVLLTSMGYLDSVDAAAAPRNSALRHLDIGCGKGALCFKLATRLGVGTVVGCDVLEAAVSECQARYGSLPPEICLDATVEATTDATLPPLSFVLIGRTDKELPFAPGSFERVSACFVLSGLPSRAGQLRFLRKAGAVMAPGGILSILVSVVPSILHMMLPKSRAQPCTACSLFARLIIQTPTGLALPASSFRGLPLMTGKAT